MGMIRSLILLLAVVVSTTPASLAFATSLGTTYFIGVDGLETLPSGTYAGLDNPNGGRLTFLFGHGDHYHGLGTYTYSGDPSAPTVLSTNANNTIPELYTSLPPLSLVEGSGAWAGHYVSGLGSAAQDVEYGNLRMLSTAALVTAGLPEDLLLFNSSSGRWTGALGSQQIGLELVSLTGGLQIADPLGNPLFGGGVGSVGAIGVGDDLDFTPVFFTTLGLPADYSASFRLLDLGAAGGGAATFGDSGTFTLAFTVVPEPGAVLLVIIGFGLLCASSTGRTRRI